MSNQPAVLAKSLPAPVVLVGGLLMIVSGCMEPAAIGDSGDRSPSPGVKPAGTGPVLSVARPTTFVTAWSHTISYSPIGVAVGDINGDKLLDIVAPNYYLTNIGLGLGSGRGTLLDMDPVWSHALVPGVDVLLADLNQDGNVDTIVGHRGLGGSVLYGQAGGSVGSVVSLPCTSLTNGLAVADLNGDGWLDIVMTDSTSNSVCLNLWDSRKNSYVMQLLDVGAQNISPTIADFNGDGLNDLAIGHIWSNTVAILYGDGRGGFSVPQQLTVEPGPRGLVSRDLNGDGRADLLVLHPESSCMRLLLSLPNGEWETRVLYAHHQPIAAVIEDFDGDAAFDLAVANLGSSDISLLLGDGQGHFADPVHIYAGVKPIALAGGDFDGDNRPVLVVGNLTTASVRLLLNTEKRDSKADR